MPDNFLVSRQIRDRILPALARLDGQAGEMDVIRSVFERLVGPDLDFDLRHGPSFPSNLCEQDASIELAYTFGGRERCGVRYSYEPTCRHGLIKNRYTLFRDRMLALMQELPGDYDRATFLRAYRIGVPREVVVEDLTVTIAAVHHYCGRPPRLKAYFSCDYQDQARARASVASLVALLERPEIDAMVEEFYGCFEVAGGARMVGFDFSPAGSVAIKIYKSGERLTVDGLQEVVARAGGGTAATSGIEVFQDIFLDGSRDPGGFDLVTAGLGREGLTLKL